MDLDQQVEAAKQEIASLSKMASAIHDELKALKRHKNDLTNKISRLQAFVDSQRPPSPLGVERIAP